MALRTYTALVTFERTDAETDYLPPEAQGACGYMAIAANDEDDIFDALRSELSGAGLNLIEVQEITEVTTDAFPADLDNHLAENVRNWESGERTVWGTIHVYIADGEA